MSSVPHDVVAVGADTNDQPEWIPERVTRTSRGRFAALRAFLRKPQAIAGVALLVALIAVAVFAPVFYPGDPLDSVAEPLIPPGTNPDYPLGTDILGRDVAAGLAHGASTSLTVGVVSTVIALLLGIVIGGVGGYFGGTVDRVLVRVTEFFQTTPTFMLLVVILAIYPPSITVLSLAIGLVGWPIIARLVRAEFRVLRQSDFVLAARSLGCGNLRIICAEILPNTLAPIIVTASVKVATAILMESGLSFLGLGDANRVSWGSMIGEGRELLRTAWYLTALPGAAIVVAVLSLNVIGDALNDALNPRQRTEEE